MKYVWLNLMTGEFSNSWNENDHKVFGEAAIAAHGEHAENSHWKLIKYECLTDNNFEFYNKMKLK